MNISPGPWRIVRLSHYTSDPEDTSIQAVEAADGKTILYTEDGYFKPRENDALAVSLVPDMLTLLERAADRLQDYCANANIHLNDSVAKEILELLKLFEVHK